MCTKNSIMSRYQTMKHAYNDLYIPLSGMPPLFIVSVSVIHKWRNITLSFSLNFLWLRLVGWGKGRGQEGHWVKYKEWPQAIQQKHLIMPYTPIPTLSIHKPVQWGVHHCRETGTYTQKMNTYTVYHVYNPSIYIEDRLYTVRHTSLRGLRNQTWYSSTFPLSQTL